MDQIDGTLSLSATDLVGHLHCKYLSEQDFAVATGNLEKPKTWDPLLQLLWERGAQHEQAFVDHLRSNGFEVTQVDGVGVTPDTVARTNEAMTQGSEIIVQGAFRRGQWVGRTDVLRRIDQPSDLGDWSYEIIDTKLARETKGGTILQLCLYADLVEAVQGERPEFCYVVAPWSDYEPVRFRMDDYSAYYRRVRGSLERFVSEHNQGSEYPEPREHCDICRWQDSCEATRRADDHLCLVAGISKVQIGELRTHGISTTTNLSEMPIPLTWKPNRGSASAIERVREQARIQITGRVSGKPLYELLPVVKGLGLSVLPEPSQGDVFFDLEGDPFAGDGGLEYLFGYAFAEDSGFLTHIGEWSTSRADERQAYENFVDFIQTRLEEFPTLHIYHFAPYEPAALKRLMGRYASREEAIDGFLRSKLFVDLYGVVRNSIRASVESYSIKKLEPFYDFRRSVPLRDANMALAKVQVGLELGDTSLLDPTVRDAVQRYNRDDCLSTAALRDWLEALRAQAVEDGTSIDRPVVQDAAPSEAVSDWQEKIEALVSQLTSDVPIDPGERNSEQQARWLLAYTLDWHRREAKAAWWEHFRLADLSADDLLDERAGLGGLEFLETSGGTARAPIHRYHFVAQETDLRGGENLRSQGGEQLGQVQAISLEDRWVDIKKRQKTADLHPEAVYSHTIVPTQVLADSLVRLGEHVAGCGIEGEGPYEPARSLILRAAPRIGEQPIIDAGETTLEAALRLAISLEGGVLPIQGPPGAGKTFTGARMICRLVQAGKTVGITANSHKVIRNLLDEVVAASEQTGVNVRCVQKVSEPEADQPRLRFTQDNTELLGAIGATANVAAGTAWLWARPDAAETVDVLFIDEAAQMSLANVLAVSQAAKSIVLLGDPQQLDQPTQGSHPEGTDVSSLHHILGGHQTVANDRGLFLGETWRLHPSITEFTSEVFYDGRLRSRPGLEVQRIVSDSRVSGSGLRYLPVQHEGNQSSSPEEAVCVSELVPEILSANTRWFDREGRERELGLEDILIIAPYNAQVFELQDRIPGARIGTVDKFQGQEAPIVIYSMTTSSYADAPRGMEFLYSLNRLNVATSRAKCICILVASPTVFEAQCRTPRQMQLANAFCRYLEMADTLQ